MSSRYTPLTVDVYSSRYMPSAGTHATDTTRASAPDVRVSAASQSAAAGVRPVRSLLPESFRSSSPATALPTVPPERMAPRATLFDASPAPATTLTGKDSMGSSSVAVCRPTRTSYSPTVARASVTLYWPVLVSWTKAPSAALGSAADTPLTTNDSSVRMPVNGMALPSSSRGRIVNSIASPAETWLGTAAFRTTDCR